MIQFAKEKYGDDVIIISSFFKDESNPIVCFIKDYKPLGMLGAAFVLMSNADVALFSSEWKSARGCRMEHMAAEEYGIEIIEME